MNLANATCITIQRVTTESRSVDLRSPCLQIDEGGMIERMDRTDFNAIMTAFERLGGPFGGRILFVEDGNGDIWAGERESEDNMDRFKAAVKAAMCGMKNPKNGF